MGVINACTLALLHKETWPPLAVSCAMQAAPSIASIVTTRNLAVLLMCCQKLELCMWPLQMEEFSSEDAQTIHLPDAEERAQLMSDPLSRLEHDEAAKAIAREDAVRMSDLRTDSDARWKDDYVGNKALRRRLR